MNSQSKVVISQSMFFPWVGLLEQIRLADVFVHYDDVQFSRGSLVNRVQIKWPGGTRWMTVPIENYSFGQTINQLRPSPSTKWRHKHLQNLAVSFQASRYRDDALDLVKSVYGQDYESVGDLSRMSILSMARYFNLTQSCRFIDSRDLGVHGKGTERVLSIVKFLNGRTYITGHGAANYLDHEAFDREGIDVQYMDYRKVRYSQPHGPFTPYVSALDLIANEGPDGVRMISSETRSWRRWINGT